MIRQTISRREALIGLGAFLTACRSTTFSTHVEDIWAGDDEAANAAGGRLRARPHKPSKPSLAAGQQTIEVAKDRTAFAYVPSGYDPKKPVAFALALHGATLNAEGPVRSLQQFAEESSVVLLSPKSLAYTWDLSIAGFGTDVEFVDKCLDFMFDRFNIDTKRCAISGFSDGASYALTLGVGNGDLFSHAIGFSPGYMAPIAEVGKPRIFISHGTKDEILPIEKCGRRLAAELKSHSYDVTYKEFDGPHTVPRDIAQQAVTWLKG